MDEHDARKPLTALLDADALARTVDVLEADGAGRLLHKKTGRLELGEIAYLLRQRVAVDVLVPLALERLAGDPLAQAIDYPGDLLTAVMEAGDAYWRDHREAWDTAMLLLAEGAVQVQAASSAGEPEHAYLPDTLGDEFMAAVLHFTGLHERKD